MDDHPLGSPSEASPVWRSQPHLNDGFLGGGGRTAARRDGLVGAKVLGLVYCRLPKAPRPPFAMGPLSFDVPGRGGSAFCASSLANAPLPLPSPFPPFFLIPVTTKKKKKRRPGHSRWQRRPLASSSEIQLMICWGSLVVCSPFHLVSRLPRKLPRGVITSQRRPNFPIRASPRTDQ